MHALYGPDRPEKIEMGWVAQCLVRCHELIWSVTTQILASRRDVVLEPGFMTHAERDGFRARAQAAGHCVKMHFVDVSRDVRLARLARRNLQGSNTFSFGVTPAMFEFMEARYEAPSAPECSQAASWISTSGE